MVSFADRNLVQRTATANLYYASTLGPPPVPRDHQGKQCRETVCQWEQIDEKTYASQHRPDCRDCSFAGPDLPTLRSIILDGGIPVVSAQEVRGLFQVNILKVRADLPYTAISHVCKWLRNKAN